jgi:hypothetical protein
LQGILTKFIQFLIVGMLDASMTMNPAKIGEMITQYFYYILDCRSNKLGEQNEQPRETHIKDYGFASANY